MKKKPSKRKNPNTKNKKSIKWLKYLKRTGIGLCFLAVISASFIAYSHQSKIEHDLSVVGNGTATVVQIHDPSCQMCQRLKSNLNAVKGEFKETIQFKTANIRTAKGKKFANHYNVPHVTLLLFNGRGKHIDTLRGVSTEDNIRTALIKLKP